MLTFAQDEKYYIITERILGFRSTDIKVIRYTKDLKSVQVNNDPWNETTDSEIEWFNKYHRKNYDGLDVNVIHNGLTLKTIHVEVTRKLPNWYFVVDNNKYHFPDSDNLYLEDIHGLRYKRVFSTLFEKSLFLFTSM